VKENDIRPDSIKEKYLQLSAEDAAHCFSSNRSAITCIACSHKENQSTFSKNGFDYSLCKNCGTLYQSPRPNIEEFEIFYKDSISSKYWAEVFFPTVAEKRREYIFKPRASSISEICKIKKLTGNKLIEIGAGYGIFLEEWSKIRPESELIAIEPSKQLAEICRNKKLVVIEKLAEKVNDYESYADLVVCFEVLEHVYDPLSFVNTLAKFVRPGGWLFMSTLCVDGFDIQMLWEKSESISPPHHINFFSILGFKHLMKKAGLIEIEISTPGVLDVEIVKKFMDKNNAFEENPRFLNKILADENLANQFQKFLSENQLSSHAWIFAKKPE
jgi:2-polyprenyl-3-methyl-5-hydroxy-6-metoxy-1,4-benzoquinol methylase